MQNESRKSSALGAAGCALLLLVFVPRSAEASPVFELLGASTGTGGYNARVTGAGSASAYFNPALLARAENRVELGMVVLSQQIGMTLDGRSHGDVPLVVGERTLLDPSGNPISNATVPTDWLQHGCPQCGNPPFAARPRQAAGDGIGTKLYAVTGFTDRIIKDRLVIGLYALIPIGDFVSAKSFYNDERDQFFSNSLHPEMYSDRMTATSLAFGAGSRIVDTLSVGVSFTLALTNAAQSATYVRDPIDYNKLFISNDVHVKANVSPHFGVAYDPLDWLHLAGTVHTPQSFKLNMGITAALPAGNESGTTREEVHDYLPWMFGLGGAVDLNPRSKHVFSIAANVKYALWSNYVDRHGENPGAQGSAFEFKNTFSESLGLHHHGGRWGSFLDFTYVPTPVPPQTGRSNYVDNDRLGAILGGEYNFEIGDLPFRVGAQLQAQSLLSRYQAKNDSLIVDELPDNTVDNKGKPVPGAAGLQTNNPGWPGFRSDGWILAAGVNLALMF